MKRRNLLKGSLALAGAAGFGALPSLTFGREPITLYQTNAFSGNFSANGKFGELGAKLATKVYGEKLGRPLRLSTIDTQGDTGAAVRKVQQALEQDDARFFVGTALSSTTLAIMPAIERAGGVLFSYVGADSVTGGDCSRSTFRWSLPTYGAINGTVRPLIESNPNWKRWYTITPDYVFGESLLQNTRTVLEEKGLELVDNSYHSLKEKEFSGYLVNAISSNADVLLLLNFGSNSIDTLRQAVSYGVKEKMDIVVAWSSGLDNFRALGSDAIAGVHFGVQYWHTLDTPANEEFVRRVQEEYGENPRFYTAADYQCATLLYDAIQRAGSPDPSDVIEALEGHAYDGLTGPETIRASDHQVDKAYLLLRGKPKDRMRDADDYVEVIASTRGLLGDGECNLAS